MSESARRIARALQKHTMDKVASQPGRTKTGRVASISPFKIETGPGIPMPSEALLWSNSAMATRDDWAVGDSVVLSLVDENLYIVQDVLFTGEVLGFAPVDGGGGDVTLPIAQSDVTGLVTALAGKSDVGHSHVIADVTGLGTALAGKASLVHTHAFSDITGTITSAQHGNLTSAGATTHHDWTQIGGKPSTFAPSTHASTHAAAGSDPLTLSQSQITSLTTDLAAKAPSASPTLTGTVVMSGATSVTVPTVAIGSGSNAATIGSVNTALGSYLTTAAAAATYSALGHTHAFSAITGTISAGQYGSSSIVNADISASAAITISKLAAGTAPAGTYNFPTLQQGGVGVSVTTHTHALDDLSDVDALTPANGTILEFNSGTGRWVATYPTTVAAHHATHEQGGVDVIDGLNLFVNYAPSPTNYNPASSTLLGNHLSAINTALGLRSLTSHTHAFSAITGSIAAGQYGSGSIVNADISGSAAIAYSKLGLTGSIVNADLSASAAIAFSKLASLSTGQVIYGVAGVATAGSPDTAGLIDKTSVQTGITGNKTYSTGTFEFSSGTLWVNTSAYLRLSGRLGVSESTYTTTGTITTPRVRQVYTGTGGHTVTLPAASTATLMVFENRGSGSVTLSRAGTDTITVAGVAGSTSVSLLPGDALLLNSDGASPWTATWLGGRQPSLNAPLASPTFTGSPVAPTVAVTSNNTSLATTAAVTTALAGYALTSHTHSLDDLTDVTALSPADGSALMFNIGTGQWQASLSFPVTAHHASHEYGGTDVISGIDLFLNYSATNYSFAGFQLLGNHINAIDTALGLRSLTSHTHAFSAITGSVAAGQYAAGSIVNADINAAAAIAQSKISNLTSDLALKAPLASPTFSGTVAMASASSVTAPTVAITSNSTAVATTSAVTTALAGYAATSHTHAFSAITGSISAGQYGAGSIVDADIGAAAAISQSKISGLTTDLAAKAALTGATFTGNVKVDRTGTAAQGKITVDVQNGQNAQFEIDEAGVERWSWGKDASTDKFFVWNGAASAIAYQISTATNIVDFTNTPTVAGTSVALATDLTSKLTVPSVVAEGQALVLSSTGIWVPRHLATQKDLDRLRDEYDAHSHDERYAVRNRPLLTALPTSPYDGQEILFQTATMLAAGYAPWVLRYNASAAVGQQWQPLGAPVMAVRAGTSPVSTVSTTYVTVAGTPTIDIPLAGKYKIIVDNNNIVTGSAGSAYAAPNGAGLAAADTNAAVVYSPSTGLGGGSAKSCEAVLTVGTMGVQIRTTASTGNIYGCELTVIPMVLA